MDFNKQIEELEKEGYYENGKIACPLVGGDHEAELWVNDKGSEAEVCEICRCIEKR